MSFTLYLSSFYRCGCLILNGTRLLACRAHNNILYSLAPHGLHSTLIEYYENPHENIALSSLKFCPATPNNASRNHQFRPNPSPGHAFASKKKCVTVCVCVWQCVCVCLYMTSPPPVSSSSTHDFCSRTGTYHRRRFDYRGTAVELSQRRIVIAQWHPQSVCGVVCFPRRWSKSQCRVPEMHTVYMLQTLTPHTLYTLVEKRW